jgi:hypothetical protein
LADAYDDPAALQRLHDDVREDLTAIRLLWRLTALEVRDEASQAALLRVAEELTRPLSRLERWHLLRPPPPPCRVASQPCWLAPPGYATNSQSSRVASTVWDD